MKSEAQWQVEEDARTLLRAEEIKQDSNRDSKAKGEIKKMVDKQEEETKILKKLVGRKSTKEKEPKENRGSAPRSNPSAPPVNNSRPSWQNR